MWDFVKDFLAQYNINLWSTDSNKQKVVKRIHFDFSEAAWNRLVEMSNEFGQEPQVFAVNTMREALLLRDLIMSAKAKGHDLEVAVIDADDAIEEVPIFK